MTNHQVVIIKAGISERTGNVYPADVLLKAVPLFHGAICYRGMDNDLRGPNRSIDQIVGKFLIPHWDEKEQAIIATFLPLEDIGIPAEAQFGMDVNGQGHSDGNHFTMDSIEVVNAVNLLTEKELGL
mgnify:CR=1 FL=1